MSKDSKEKLAYYTVFITFLAFYFLYFVASKPKIILAQSTSFCSSDADCPAYSSGTTCYYNGRCYISPITGLGHCTYDEDTSYPLCQCSYTIGDTCYYDPDVVCDNNVGWTCVYKTDTNKPSCDPYSQNGICYYGGSAECGTFNCDPIGWHCIYPYSCNLGECGTCTSSGCQANNADCDDFNPCTQDSCDPSTHTCSHSNVADGTSFTVAGQTIVCCNGEEHLLSTDPGICCNGVWISGGECCDNSDCTDPSKPICDTNNHICRACNSNSECGSGKCCAYLVDPNRGDCVSSGTIIGNALCDEPTWAYNYSLLLKSLIENPFSINE